MSPLKRALYMVVLPVVMGHAGCALLHGATKPAAYAAELASCEKESKTWAEYTPCCEDVARSYSRDPSFCSPSDGGAE